MFRDVVILSVLLLFASAFKLATAAASIGTSKACYAVNEDLLVTYFVTTGQAGDQIGIYRLNSMGGLITPPVIRAPTCTGTCVPQPNQGTIVIPQSLSPGFQFRTLLLRSNMAVVVQGARFTISNSCPATIAPTTRPTKFPTPPPTKLPTKLPTKRPTKAPSRAPSRAPVQSPTGSPTKLPTNSPTAAPTTVAPSKRPTSSPTKSPTKSPTLPPTNPPAKSPTAAPTVLTAPTNKPTSAPSKASQISPVTKQAWLDARNDLAAMVAKDARLTPEFVRLGFHDCVGRCDGCVDMTSIDNRGLLRPINALLPIAAKYCNATTRLTRADMVALAAMVAVDVAPHGPMNQLVPFDMKWIGRTNCEDDSLTNCVDATNGQPVPCGPTSGPPRVLPDIHMNSQQVRSYFAANFGFDDRETSAIMGAHCVGRLVHQESGITGNIGWVPDNTVVQNSFYKELVGNLNTFTTDPAQIIAASLNFRQLSDNLNPDFTERNYYGRFIGPGGSDPHTIMLNSDVGIVRELTTANVNPVTGKQSCDVGGPNACPVSSTFSHALSFALDNTGWMIAFRDAFEKMLTNGYQKDASCTDTLCQLHI